MELPPGMAELPTLRKNWPTGRFLTYPEVPGEVPELPTLRKNWPTGRFLTYLLKGSSSPRRPQLLSSKFATIVDLVELCYLSIPP